MEQVRAESEVASTVDQIVLQLDTALPLIDGPDADLRAGLDELADQIDEMRQDLRFVTLESLQVFATLSERQRERVADALRDLAVLVLSLVMVLTTAVVALVWSLLVGRRRTAEIARARGRLRTIVSTSSDGVLVVDRDGTILDCNRAVERIFGYSREEALGAQMADLIIPDHLKAAHQAGMDAHLRGGQRRLLGKGLVQMEARDRLGRVFPVELSVNTAESEEGEIFVAFVRDISDRLAAERELVNARDKALAGEKAKAEFLAVMSHEMRTPLNGILGGLELLSGTDLSQRQTGFVDIMGRSGQMLLHHVNSVLDISLDDAGKTVLRPEAFDPATLLQDVADSQSMQAEARGNQLHVRIEDDLGQVVGDRTRALHVIVNLVANAIKFTRDGQITLSAQRQSDSDMIEFCVADTGIGIPSEDQPRIFDDFVTLDTRYSREVEGTGLGLGIARRLVGAMGGSIGVRSAPGQGSEFWFSIPLPPASDADMEPPEAGVAAEPDDQPRPMRLKDSITVLIVEDNDINRLIVRELLVDLGCKTVQASDGIEAQTLAAATPFALILMDISMPRQDGIAATQAIRGSDGPNASVPIVALTAHALPSEIERFHEAGMNDVLVKPLTRAALIALFNRLFPGQLVEAAGSDQSQGGVVTPGVISSAIAELATLLDRLSDLIDGNGSMQEVTDTAHLAAGLAAVSGLSDLQDAFVTLELAVSELEGEPGEKEALGVMLSEAKQLFQNHHVTG
ncbi:ATP-binding protein [Nioella aestuarii]|uniref:hybrid sensor histidine kinase/response regulator n=1 Tax=Nioella aestuarii TaxID=1662864 RepID=UPI003D7F36CF